MKPRLFVIVFCVVMLNKFAYCSETANISDVDNAACYYKEAALIFKQSNPQSLSQEQQCKYIDELRVYYPIKDIKNADKLFELFRQGCNQKKCVWGTDFSREGFFTTLYYANDVKMLSNFINSVVIEKFLNGSNKETIELLLCNLILSKRIVEERCIVNFITACNEQEMCIKIANKILDKLTSHELKRLHDGFNLQTQLPLLSEIVLAERDILISWIKNNPAHFLQCLESVANPVMIESGAMMGYKTNNVTPAKSEIKKAKQKLKHVDYIMIDKYYKKLSESTRVNKKNFNGDYDINNEIKQLPNSITKEILLNTIPSLKDAYQHEQSLKSQKELFKTNIKKRNRSRNYKSVEF
ncbi:MAG: hypothetical protein LBP59_05700 [Planctomycetaceae bacterium]|jgi:hypothetical protein|nr:hypothetical protein [Planctomycetaceae bacterium]